MLNKNILIIGGNGIIGQSISRILKLRHKEATIFIGTRKVKLKNDIQIDVNDHHSFSVLLTKKIDCIVMCTIDNKNNMLKFCIKNGIHYIDITKPTTALSEAYELVKHKDSNSKIVFSSGWMSGIVPNLIKANSYDKEIVEKVKLIVYYSTKDLAGKSSADFMAENVIKSFNYYRNHKTIKTKHFLESEKHHFYFDLGKRYVYNIDLPDLYTLNAIENIPSVSSKVTYNSKITTLLLGVLQKMNLFSLMNLKERKVFFAGNGKGDLSVFEIVLETNQRSYKIVVKSTNGQAEITAFSTVIHIEKLFQKNIANGIYFSHQLYTQEPREFLKNIYKNPSIEIQTLIN